MKLAKNIIYNIVQESKSYNTLEDIEKLVEQTGNLAVVPVQPLYIALSGSSSDQVAEVLPKLSKPQRQAMLDLDLWVKDEVDYQSFDFWIQAYAKVQNDTIIQEFINSEDFALYLRSRVNIYTFDVEDPQYPDHDFYFLTDDTQLLVEYGEDYENPNELKFLIRNLYDELGVENAYAHLFKVVNDSHMVLEEERYQSKKTRLRDYGFVDYYDALEQTNEYMSYKALEKFVKEHRSLTGNVDSNSRNQSLHQAALVSFDERENLINEALAKVESDKRLAYLHFTFVRLVNSAITLQDALKGGRIELTRISKQTKMYLNLGLEYLIENTEDDVLFDRFDFFDIFRVGKTLLGLERKKLKKAISKTPFDKDDYEYFLGAWLNSFLENSFLDYPKVKTFGASLHAKDIDHLNVYFFWKEQTAMFIELLPFAQTFFKTFFDLKEQSKIHDEFYLNYEVSNIDFESIMISSFINFALGTQTDQDVNKMGVTIFELKSFFNDFFYKNGDEYLLLPFEDEKMAGKLKDFVSRYGMSEIKDFDFYLHGILSEHLSGYEFDTLEDEEFKHVGGPILLNTLLKN